MEKFWLEKDAQEEQEEGRMIWYVHILFYNTLHPEHTLTD